MNNLRAISVLIVAAMFLFSGTHIIHPGVGETAPEIALPGPDDEIRKLSSLRGKVVLIDFWASWCKPCRKENREYAKLYRDFKDKKFIQASGFDIFSVSMDVNKEQWIQAIENDHMVWENHVSDLKKWESSVVQDYNFKYLPHNLIIDAEGKVLAKELYGERLRSFMSTLLEE